MPFVRVKPERKVAACDAVEPSVAQRLVTPRAHCSEPSMMVVSGPLSEQIAMALLAVVIGS